MDHLRRSAPAAGRASSAAEDPQFLPGQAAPLDDRMQGVRGERERAAAQIQRSLKVWRKTDGPEPESPESKEDDEKKADEEKEGEQGEEKKDDKGDEKEAKGDEAGKDKPPPISAKPQGVGLKIFRMADKKRGDHVFNNGLVKTMNELQGPLEPVSPGVKGILDGAIGTIQGLLGHEAFHLTVNKGDDTAGGDENSVAFGNALSAFRTSWAAFGNALADAETAPEEERADKLAA